MPTNPVTAPVAAEVRQETASESALFAAAKQAITNCNWKVGELASIWTSSYAGGRTDKDFGDAIGLSEDQVYQRRRVYDRFASQTDTYRNLSWSHFYAALTWDDADACLQWACEQYASVAEMKAWRNVQHGNSDTVSESGNLGSSEDPSGGGEGAGQDAGGDGSDASGEDAGTDAAGMTPQDSPPRPPRNGKDKPGGASQDPLVTQRAKTIKTTEALMREIDALDSLRKFPQHDAITKSLCKVVETVRAVQ